MADDLAAIAAAYFEPLFPGRPNVPETHGPRAIHDTYGEDLSAMGADQGGDPPFEVGEPLYRVRR